MSDHPRMDWSNADLAGTFKLFKQKCEIYFNVKDTKVDKMVNHILLYAGDEGIKIYNSWNLSDSDRTDPSLVWEKFQAHIEPKVNFRVQRFYLQKYSQAGGESIDDYVTRCKLQAQKCKFNQAEAEERLIEQLIIGTNIAELQKELLGHDDKLTLEKALDIGRTTEASTSHMTQLQSVQSNHTNVHYVRAANPSKGCRFCGRAHLKEDRCPAYGSTCKKCGGRNHWQAVCKKSDGGQGQPKRGRGQHVVRARSKTRREWHSDGASAAYRRKRDVHAVGLQRGYAEPQDKLEAQFEHLSFASLTTNGTTMDTRRSIRQSRHQTAQYTQGANSRPEGQSGHRGPREHTPAEGIQEDVP